MLIESSRSQTQPTSLPRLKWKSLVPNVPEAAREWQHGARESLPSVVDKAGKGWSKCQGTMREGGRLLSFFQAVIKLTCPAPAPAKVEFLYIKGVQ